MGRLAPEPAGLCGCDHVPAGVAQAEAVGCALARKRNCDLVIRGVAASIPIREKTRILIALVRRVGAGGEFCSLYKAGPRAAPIDASQLWTPLTISPFF